MDEECVWRWLGALKFTYYSDFCHFSNSSEFKTQTILPYLTDFHLHVRQGIFAEGLVKEIRKGGVNRVLVMPNTIPPLTTTRLVLDYLDFLQNKEPQVEFFGTLFLHSGLTRAELRAAKQSGRILGCKLYPQGVTTNSELGTRDEDLNHVFAAMEEFGLVLQVHGEEPGAPILDAERVFVVRLLDWRLKYPNLKIVLEHVSTKEGVDFVSNSGPNTAATVTPHHLLLTIDDVVGQNFNFCKPVPKLRHDLEAIQNIVRAANPKFFLGSDSAPHEKHYKFTQKSAAGIFNSTFLTPYLLDFFDGNLQQIFNFGCRFGPQFYDLPVDQHQSLRVHKKELLIQEEIELCTGQKIVPFKSGQTLKFSISL